MSDLVKYGRRVIGDCGGMSRVHGFGLVIDGGNQVVIWDHESDTEYEYEPRNGAWYEINDSQHAWQIETDRAYYLQRRPTTHLEIFLSMECSRLREQLASAKGMIQELLELSDFDCGSAYIRRAYVDRWRELRDKAKTLE